MFILDLMDGLTQPEHIFLRHMMVHLLSLILPGDLDLEVVVALLFTLLVDEPRGLVLEDVLRVATASRDSAFVFDRHLLHWSW